MSHFKFQPFNFLYAGIIFMSFCCLLIFFYIDLFKKFFQYDTSRLSNSLDPDQATEARKYVWPDLD